MRHPDDIDGGPGGRADDPAVPEAGPDPGSKQGSPTGPGSASDYGREEATTIAALPQFKSAELMPETPGKLLAALRSQVSQLTVEHSGSGIRHEQGRYVVLPRTLRSAWMARVDHSLLGETRFLVGQTRSTWILVYDKSPEKVYEDPRFMGMELKVRDVARTPRGKLMYVSRIARSDLDQLNAIAAQDAGDRLPSETLAPTEGAFRFEETLERLRQAVLLGSTHPDFDPFAFFATVHFMTPTQGSTGNYYYMEAGDPADPMTCELHVGTDPQLPESSYGSKATLAYRSERSYLYVDIAV